MEEAIKVVNLSKNYNGFKALDSLNLEVEEGEFFGIIGPNGAGKTTAIKILCCLLQPSEGSAFVDNLNVREEEMEVKKRIGYLAEGVPLYEGLTPWQYLKFFAKLYHLPSEVWKRRAQEYLEELEILERKDSKIGNLSKGMQKKVAITRALLHDPKILIFDEPTAGLDPFTANFIKEFMKKLVGGDKTVFMSTHYLHEAEKLCDRVGILKKGRLIAQGEISELEDKFGKGDLDEIFMKAIKNS